MQFVRVASAVSPEDVLVSEKLHSRPAREPDLEGEIRAFHELSALLLKSPQTSVQHFLELALELCRAGSSGVSLLEPDQVGGVEFRWTALAGEFSPYVGGTTPRHHSPCGLCLDQGTTILVSRPARIFDYFNKAHVPIIEGLIVPLYDTGRKPLGTLWVVTHEEGHGFDATDARVMEQLAVQLVLALKWQRDSDKMTRKLASLEQQARSSAQEAVHKDALIAEVNHRVKNSVQSSISLLRMQARTVRSAEAQEALAEAQTRLVVFAHVHELLYRSASSAQKVEMTSLLDALAHALRASFADQGDRIRLTVHSDDISMHPDQAVPLALIINEAVTNAYKHAYPDGQAGEISIRLEKRDGSLNLSVSDHGVGMASSHRDGSLGLRLIHSFAQQLSGTLTVASEGGTNLTLIVPRQ